MVSQAFASYKEMKNSLRYQENWQCEFRARMNFTSNNEVQHTKNQMKVENKLPLNFDTKPVPPPEVQQVVFYFP